ncbi:MAG: sugar O-acetyltransferase [[Lactobacillus] timonensis]|jgi:acetyltransferase-like isoleucine patch superfamily enzyme|uniref:sugar O-acetyltransferase n=1 Tax=[Lactobacillus] timonensis TaxID=1970790 RepID=UPI002354E334|nr:sugar O-acetyltransferase [[Lactobacillus] timonensis]MCI1925760.1 sugar O-acetyltransferase [[Lactobacillus] timonensis]MCI1957121.1 sugar O-acetyltransferase [[Lactobacillus] timonensis]MCI1970194.1 sugar O-acetyltransferase [[Lactobacillus] timonensis]MCI2006385.1 sugar O-acetyltransferase [[Lactobacillus] timonensis]
MTVTTTLSRQNIVELQPIIQKNQQLVQKLNTTVHSQAEIVTIVSDLIQQKIDSSVEIRLPFYTDFGRNIHFGKNIFINSGVTFTDLGGIYLSDGVQIAPNVTLASVNHPLSPDERHSVELKPIYVHKNAWIGANATILPGVSIGENAVIAAGAVVSRNVPANTVVAGIPARVIKTINQ